MRRLWVVAALLFGPWLSLTEAQYVRIKIDLNEYKITGEASTTNPEMPGMPGMPGDGTYPTTPKVPPLWVEIRLKINKIDEVKTQLGNFYQIEHRWGKSLIPSEDVFIEAVQFHEVILRYKAKEKEFSKGKPTAEQYLGMAEWCLQHGLLKEFTDTMGKFGKSYDTHPKFKAFEQVDKELKEAPKQDDPGATKIIAQAKERSYKSSTSKDGHYHMFYPTLLKDSAVQLRLANLERTYHSFYYWIALKSEKVLPQPGHRFVVVLEPGRQEFLIQKNSHTAKPLMEAGFLTQGNNVVFLSVKPITKAYNMMEEMNIEYWNKFGVSQEKILSGDTGKLDLNTSIGEAAKLSTLGLFQKALEDENGQASASHEAIQQLLAGADVLPRNVLTAEWLRYGLASFFETPRLSFFDCTALPSWTNLINFRFHREHTKKLADDDRALVLLRVITDDYFNQAHVSLQQAENAEDKAAAAKEAHERLELAQASAWSLTYYLMRSKDDMLRIFKYCDELKKLPRDIEYTPTVLAATFGKAMDWKLNPMTEPIPVTLNDLDALSAAWYKHMDYTRLDIPIDDSILADMKTPKKKKTPPPSGMGGMPGMPGSPGPGAGPGFGM
jgi:hypothetical protein